jgi:hypothetical protein
MKLLVLTMIIKERVDVYICSGTCSTETQYAGQYMLVDGPVSD